MEGMAASRKVIEIGIGDREELDRRVKSKKGSQREAFRARIVLYRGAGFSQREVARKMDTSQVSVSRWSRRYERMGIEGLLDRAGRGRKPTISATIREAIIVGATKPPLGCVRHSTRTMARQVGVSQHTVRMMWNRNGIRPHLLRTFKISKDPNFESKFWDVIGLYLNPPEQAVLFCCDEKNQCQALERTQPGLPLGVGHIRTRTHDYTRHGTTTLFAALDYATGRVLGHCAQKHRGKEWLNFLKEIDRSVPRQMSIHIIADNYGTHKSQEVKKWLEKHPRFSMHYTPTSSSWLNLVERFFADITQECIRDGSFSSVAELTSSINVYLEQRNSNPKPYRWHSKGEEILRKINKARNAIDNSI